jgi:flagellar motor switch protein FliN/FliY
VDRNSNKKKENHVDLVTVSGVRFTSFEGEQDIVGGPRTNLDISKDIIMKVTVELGRTRMNVKKILDMSRGSIVELNKVAGEPVELFVNGKLVAYGEIIVMEDKFGLRVTSIAKEKEA